MSDSEFSDIEEEQCNDEKEHLFRKATEHVQQIYQHISQPQLLQLYAHYKQATVGKCSAIKPGLFQIQARAKWQAWLQLEEMPAEEAKKKYVDIVKDLDKNWFERTINEMQLNKKVDKVGWVVHSTLCNNEAEQIDDNNKTAFDWVQNADLEGLKLYMHNNGEYKSNLLQQHDENGMGLVHWATDRNAAHILEYLLNCGANVNFRDSNQQTPLHYAASCGHRESIEILIKHGADFKMCDVDGLSCLDVAENIEIQHLIKELI